MERRDFIKKSAIVAAAAAVAPEMLSAQGRTTVDPATFEILSDTIAGGIRTIVAQPCAAVCSKQIDITIDVAAGTIASCKFTRGCPGNAIGLCSLIKGMKVKDVIARLDGTPCGGRGTSCPDQLARVLKAALKK